MSAASPVIISDQELRAFFEAFALAFSEFNGSCIAERYDTPYISLNADGALRHFTTADEIARYFQEHLNRYRAQGCRRCRFSDLESLALGRDSALASLTWYLLTTDGAVVSTWRESYMCRRGPQGLLIYASIDHVE